ncbi:D-ribitol-5-phosphate cytidylyltransferase isoform X2 [Pangasianodon hypophthalmus]|uniref:D-ribitol-5-phosphate cytidylyltransferase isoform X2 n=1 Tax=Pangasianodon hypophthalmus TaxID=310915 RepID=UPI000EFEFBBE|nr:D-ribitol-5-phosphate cytidylyltransferase isoform X2 [Pangasianodon hypophthalmus]
MMGSDAVDFPVAVVLPAAGCGERTGLATPKQFCTFLNRPLISFTIETFERIPWIESIVVVVAKESHDLMLHIIHQFHHTKVKVVEGGTTRHRSIFKGLQAFSESTEGPVLPRPKVVIIHDAVRPFVDEDFLLKITLAAKEQGASGAIRPLVSTVIATTSEGFLDHSLERTKYRASEMPQGFLYDVIYQAYQRVTYKRDLAAAESIIKETLSLSACLISGAMAETVELSSRLQKNLESHHMAVDVIACTKENNELLLKTRNFIQISTSGASLSETEEMVKVFEETKHALLYPVVIVLVHLHKSDEASDIQKNDELTALMDLSMKVKQGNILLYSVRIIYSKVPELWERSVARLSEITESLIRDRNPVLTGQMLRA